MGLRIGHDTWVVQRAPLVVDIRDNTAYRNWAGATEFTVRNGSFQPFESAAGTEDNVDREFTMNKRLVFHPPGAFVPRHTDRIKYDGVVYEVVGKINPWMYKGRVHHYEYVCQVMEDSYASPVPEPIEGLPGNQWNPIVIGHGPPSGPMPDVSIYIDIDTGDVYEWDV